MSQARTPRHDNRKPPASGTPLVTVKRENTSDCLEITNDKKYPFAHVKPVFKVGTPIYAPWKTKRWFCGVIASCREEHFTLNPSPYGPRRFYSISFDDGDSLESVEDYEVFSREDYELTRKKRNWKGVRNVTDESYPDDQWASLVGWYEVTIDGSEVPFAKLEGEQ